MRFLLITLLMVLGLDAACAQPLRSSPALAPKLDSSASNGSRNADYIVALVDSVPITYHEVQFRVLQREKEITNQGGALPPREEIWKSELQELIDERLQVQAAHRAGIKIEPAALQAATQRVAEQNQMNMDELKKHVEQNGGWSAFQEDLTNQLLIERLRQQVLPSKVKVSEADIDAFLSEQKRPVQANAVELNLAHLLIEMPEHASEATQKELWMKAQEAFDHAAAGEDFQSLVQRYATHPNSPLVGVLGLKKADHYPELFVQATIDLPIGAVVGPIQSAAGFHILKLLDKHTTNAPLTLQQMHTRHILIRLSPTMSEQQAKAKLAQIRSEIVAKKISFEEAAAKYSQDASAGQGGDLGWTNPGMFVPEFESVINQLPLGVISEPFQSRFGVHLVEVLERHTVEITPQQERELARQAIKDKRLVKVQEDWIHDLRVQAFIEYKSAPDASLRP